MNHPRSEAEPAPEQAGAGWLREALAEAAYDVTPSPLPLAAVERRGRRLRYRRRAAVLGAGAGMLLAPLAVVALRGTGTGPDAEHSPPPAASVSASPAPTVSPTAPAPTPRVVAPGERVTAAPGFRLWLTAEGKHWMTPSSPGPEFRSVVDGNVDSGTPGVSLQSEITRSRAYLSGLYYGGKGVASGVDVETAAGTVHGKLIELAGHPGWGVWYATAAVGPGGGGAGFVSEVSVHDTEGRLYARITAR
ncbi:hypothetical protein ACFW1F_11005 [Streptomyces bungoensis]|uniref:hypothetical protein n=1 Tax=Streptomyces bungoensis TaxID=285568 RepID=UPI003417170E